MSDGLEVAARRIDLLAAFTVLALSGGLEVAARAVV